MNLPISHKKEEAMGGRGGWPWEQGEGPVSASEGAYGCVNLGQGTSRNALPLSSCLQASLSQGLASKDESPLKTHKELSQFRFQESTAVRKGRPVV